MLLLLFVVIVIIVVVIVIVETGQFSGGLSLLSGGLAEGEHLRSTQATE